MYDVVDGIVQELVYDLVVFDYGKSGLKGSYLLFDFGFVGFCFNICQDIDCDFVVFFGVSYFCVVGREGQYGQLVCGLVIDIGMGCLEEFLDFIVYYLEQLVVDFNILVVYVLLDLLSVVGVYCFVIINGDVLLMDIDCVLYLCKVIEWLGIVLCISMYQVGENDCCMVWDWWLEIYDIDGLLMWIGVGEWIWCLLCNLVQLCFNMFVDNNLCGFGLFQCDCNFDYYQDDGVFYEKCLCLWVELKG